MKSKRRPLCPFFDMCHNVDGETAESAEMAARLSCFIQSLYQFYFNYVLTGRPEVRKRINLGNVVASVEHNLQRWLPIQSKVQR
jgi:hypothetical protein